jgi:DDE superfamily endonuclease
MWCIPPEQDGQFVARMEQILEVYRKPYDPRRPVICMDEQPFQLILESRKSIPMGKGQPQRIDHEYVREGTCTVWMFVEPLACWRDVQVTERRTMVDWAQQVRRIVDHPRYAQAELITLVSDNLNTHDLGSLYEAFVPQEALRLARKLALLHTPKHGSWLDMAEPELSVLTRQAFGDYIAKQAEVADRGLAWAAERNTKQVGIDWQFRTEDARIKLKRLYPTIKT